MAGVKKVVIGELYRGEKALEYLKDAGVVVEIYKRNPKWDNELLDLFGKDIEKVEAKEGNVKLEEDKDKLDDLSIPTGNVPIARA